MPPKVSSSSGRGGRSSTKGKEVLLALPEPITKKATTTSSRSPTQTGSSTQKGKLEGSLTQTTTVKSESSTQESPKPTTTKQTVADYAWSIQTLLALEDIGLTKIPKLSKKTWAEMASESDDDSETDLQKQKEKTQKTGGQMKRCRVKNRIFRCNKNTEDGEGNENLRRFCLCVYAATKL